MRYLLNFIHIGFYIFVLLILASGCTNSEKIDKSSILERPIGVQILDNDRLLITDGGGLFDWRTRGSKVMIINREKQIEWVYDAGLVFAHSAIMLKNGNVLIPDTNNDRLVEVSMDKKVVWSTDMLDDGKLKDGSTLFYPNHVQELENGHFLVSDRLNNRVIEIDREGNIFRQLTQAKKQHAPLQLENGNIIIADSDSNKIIEIDSTGSLVWQYGRNLAWPRYAHRQKNGNTLITDSRNNRIIEINPTGEIVFELNDTLISPYMALKLDNGDYLICDSQHGRLIQVNADKKIVWSFRNISTPDFTSEPINTGAENLLENGMPEGWNICNLVDHGSGQWTVSQESPFEGKNCFLIEASGPSPYRKWFGQRIKIKNLKTLEISAMIRTKDIKGAAALSVSYYDELGGLIGGTTGKQIREDQDWQRSIISSKPPKKTHHIEISLGLTGSGKAWFDDITYISN